MIGRKIIGAALSVLTAASLLTAAASAYIEVPPEKTDYLSATADSWKLSISSGYGVDYGKLKAVHAVVEITDEAAYLADKESGLYGDGETAFADFTGVLAFGGAEWLQFNIESFEESEAGAETAGVRPLGDGTYLLTAEIPEGTEPSPLMCTISLAEWGNRSPDYALRIRSFGLYADDFEPLIVFGADGEQMEPPELVLPDASETEPVQTEEPAETSASESETETEAEVSAPETTAAPAETSAEGGETEAAETAPPAEAPPVQAISSDSFASRDSGLMIVLIAAGVLVAAALIGILLVAFKKRK